MVFYLKYRPQKIAQIDNEKVRETLVPILSTGKPPHALLFAGPKGTGKTSAARIVAKSINCLNNKGKGEPCSKCSICSSITQGTNLDVLEIDAASNRGIDEIRSLRQRIKLAPSHNRKKVYIIDEVHMLTKEAFNALLKTLEEPPVHAYFVLATTQKEKLPETILSRCLLVKFKKAKQEEIVRALERITKGEDLKAEKEALELLAQKSDGSFRDAAKLLEQASFSAKKINLEGISKILGLDRDFKEEDFVKYLVQKNAKKALSFILKAKEEGLDLSILIEKILGLFHQHLLKKYGVEEEDFYFLPFLEKLSIEELKTLIELFSKAALELKTAIIEELPLELAVVEWVEMSNLDSEPQTSKKDQSFQDWEDLITEIKPLNHSLAGVLRGCLPKFKEDVLHLEAFYQFHFERLSDGKVKKILEKVAGKITGKPIKVKVSLKERG